MLAWLGVGRVLNLVEDDEYHARRPPGGRGRALAERRHRGAPAAADRLRPAPARRARAAGREVHRHGWTRARAPTFTAARAGSARPRWPRASSRSATGIDIDAAMDAVRAMKPSADPLPHQREDCGVVDPRAAGRRTDTAGASPTKLGRRRNSAALSRSGAHRRGRYPLGPQHRLDRGRSAPARAACTLRALIVTCSSSGSSRPSATAPWSANRRAPGSTRAS